MKVAVAGASGFVGKALIEILKKNHEVVALSRSERPAEEGVEWRCCDLFSLLDAERALQDIDVAIYLVHSMRPSAHLTQGTFDDFDLIVADNFVRAARKSGVKQIIYLGGMRPPRSEGSPRYLRGRWEIERIFLKSAIPSTILRASVILGSEGSAFHIMTRLTEKFPILICPRWTRSSLQPVALQDIAFCINYCVGHEEVFNRTFDVGGPLKTNYQEMMMEIAYQLGLRRRVWRTPFVNSWLSTLWVCLVTKAPRTLVHAMVNGLRTPLVTDPQRELKVPGYHLADYKEALKISLANYSEKRLPLAFYDTAAPRHVMRSVQRMDLPSGQSAESVAKAYLEYLPKTQPGFLKVEVQGNWVYFAWRFPFVKLLILEYAPQRSWVDRQLFYVRGGLLARKTVRGRLEFREILGGESVIAAIHDFEPRMPWYMYRWTQALFHLWTMKRFGAYLNKKY